MFFFLKNSFAKSKLTCSFLDEIEKCKHEIYSFLNKEQDGNFQFCYKCLKTEINMMNMKNPKTGLSI